MKAILSTLCKFTFLASALTAVLSAGMFSKGTITFEQGVATLLICITGAIISGATVYHMEGGYIGENRSNL